jgi:hypothetical protein
MDRFPSPSESFSLRFQSFTKLQPQIAKTEITKIEKRQNYQPYWCRFKLQLDRNPHRSTKCSPVFASFMEYWKVRFDQSDWVHTFSHSRRPRSLDCPSDHEIQYVPTQFCSRQGQLINPPDVLLAIRHCVRGEDCLNHDCKLYRIVASVRRVQFWTIEGETFGVLSFDWSERNRRRRDMIPNDRTRKIGTIPRQRNALLKSGFTGLRFCRSSSGNCSTSIDSRSGTSSAEAFNGSQKLQIELLSLKYVSKFGLNMGNFLTINQSEIALLLSRRSATLC